MDKASEHTVSHHRALERDQVEYHALATTPNGGVKMVLIVNITAMGIMARSEMPVEPRDHAKIVLPIVGAVDAEIRWALGGRIGFAFATPIAGGDYADVLGAMRR